ncbi:DUF1971 domain-containing protein [Novosphingobium sp.]|uniref:DUF1971 domain-containing protein n=1 Tax=Novosphingobium sp. TaxID=1874826 RepID=UPI00352584B7
MPAQVTEADLEALVPAFYARVRQDDLIGPVFNTAIHDWDHHLVQLVAFWSSVMRSTGRYKGSPMVAHLRHKAVITPEMFDRWLNLWGEVTAELLPADKAAAMQAKAATIGESLKLALFFRLPKGAPTQPYKVTAEWDEVTLPAAIRGRHNTKAGVWGLLRVLEGRAALVFEDPARTVEVTPDRPAEIPPEQWHHVELGGRARMKVEFYREKPLS